MRTALPVVVLLIAAVAVFFLMAQRDHGPSSALEGGAEPAEAAVETGELSTLASETESADRSAATDTEGSEPAGATPVATSGDTGDASLTVTVRGSDGSPRRDVHVIVRTTRESHGQLAYFRERSDAEGLAAFPALPPGQLHICTDRTGWDPVHEIDLAPGEARALDVELPLGLHVVGQVVDGGGAPVAGAGIWLSSRTTGFTSGAIAVHADGGGNFELRDVPNEPSICAIAAGYGPSELVDLELLDKSMSPLRVVLTLELGGASIEGTVSDATGAPIAGAIVALGSDRGFVDTRANETVKERLKVRSTKTDEAGRYRLVGLAPGEEALRVRGPRDRRPLFAVHREDLTIAEGEARRIDVTLEEAATIYGRMFDANEEPLGGGTVRAFDVALDRSFLQSGQVDDDNPFGHAAVLVGEDGRYRLEGVPSGTVHIYGQEPRERRRTMGAVVRYTYETLELAPGESREWNPILTDGHVIEGVVRYRDGEPIVNVFVSASRTGPDVRDRRSLYTGDGTFRFVQLDDAPHDVRVQIWDLPEGAHEPKALGVHPDGEPLELVADFDAPIEYEESFVRVRVNDSAGRVAAGESLGVLLEPEDSNSWHLPDQEGDVWVFDVDKPGRYRIVVMKVERAIYAGQWFDVPEGATVDLGTVETEAGATLVIHFGVEEGHELEGVHFSYSPERCRRPESFELPRGERQVTVEGLLAGPGEIQLVGDNVQRHSQAVTLRASETTEIELDLVAAVPVQYVVERAEGLDPGGMEARFVRRDTGELVRDISVRDLARYRNPIRWTAFLAPGPYRFEVTLENGMGTTREFDVPSLDPDEAPEVKVSF